MYILTCKTQKKVLVRCPDFRVELYTNMAFDTAKVSHLHIKVSSLRGSAVAHIIEF